MTSPTELLKPVLLRSTTPGPNEKVLRYLEGMRENADEPRSMLGDDQYAGTPRMDRKGLEGGSPKVLSPSPKKSKAIHQFEELAYADPKSNGKTKTNGRDIEDDNDDMASNKQNGQLSDIAELPHHEPGPNDPPGPRYESFDSGPSFGNMGPLPPDAYPSQTWRPSHQQVPPLFINGLNGTGNAPLPSRFPDTLLSPKATSARAPLDRSSSPSKAKGHHQDEAHSGVNPMSPKAASKLPMSKLGDADELFSPLSPRSKATGKTLGTAHPPLPPSMTGDTYIDNIASPRSRAMSKVPSISPSDSQSQVKQSKSVAKSPPLSPIKAAQPVAEREAGADLSRNTSRQTPLSPSGRSQGFGSAMSGLNNHQNRQFSPYRHAPTQEDLLYAVIRGRTVVPPEPDVHEKDPSLHANGKQSAIGSPSKVPTTLSMAKPLASPSRAPTKNDHDITPTPSRPHSPAELDQEEEERIVHETLSRTPRTSYYAGSIIAPDLINSRFHDLDLCILLQQESADNVHEVVKRTLRKAIYQRMKKLGMKYDRDSIKKYRESFHNHDPSVHLTSNPVASATEEPPGWAKEILDSMDRMQQRIDGLVPKIEDLRGSRSFPVDGSRYNQAHTFHSSDVDQYGRTPMTQTVNIHTQPTGTAADSMFQQPETEVIVETGEDGVDHDRDFLDDEDETQGGHNQGYTRGLRHTAIRSRTHGPMSDFDDREESPGQQYLEEELYKLRQKPHGSQSARSHRTWELARDDDEPDDYDDEGDEDQAHHQEASGLPTIPDSTEGVYTNQRRPSPPLPPLPEESTDVVPASQPWVGEYSGEAPALLPWQRIHQRLLDWAISWPMIQLDNALNSTTRGQQVDEVALSIWSTQTYKRYVRARMTDSPQGVVDRMFIPPNVADNINNAVFNGRHGDACGMLRDLWSPFGLEGMPRLLLVLAKHRSDANHWVVHRFSLPDGALTTYDSYPERTLPDGRPLGWWFAIRVAWPNAVYPSPDHLIQKMVRLHRPMQLPIDNSVAAAGIWRNLLMGSRAERSLDLERLRDLINNEVQNLRQRKQVGKLSIGAPRPTWEDMT